MIKYPNGEITLFYPDKRHIQDACQWFWDSSKPEEAHRVLMGLFGYEKEIVDEAYAQFEAGIKWHEINFNKLFTITQKVY